MEDETVFDEDPEGKKSEKLKKSVKQAYKLNQQKKAFKARGGSGGRGGRWKGRGGRGGYGGFQPGFGAKRNYRQEFLPGSYGNYFPQPPPQSYPPPASGPQGSAPICWKCINVCFLVNSSFYFFPLFFRCNEPGHLQARCTALPKTR